MQTGIKAPRISKNKFKHPLLRQLRDQQVKYAPQEKKIAQAKQAEKLLAEIEPHKEYPYEYVEHRVTGFRPDHAHSALIPGEAVRHDLRLFIEDLTDAANIEVEQFDEEVLTVEQLAEELNVSTKTISRWRDQGLVSWKFIFDGRKRVGFRRSSVDQFAEENKSRVERGSKFSQLNDEERDQIISAARRLAHAGGCPAEVTKRIARRTGRSVETIRYTLKQFDEEHPELAIFPNKTGPLDEAAREEIYTEYADGTSVDDLAQRYCRTKTSIYRIVNEVRAARIAEMPLDSIYHESFDDPNMEAEILGPMPEAEPGSKRKVKPSGDLPFYLARLYDTNLLTREQEQHLFRKMNFLKYRASKLREQLDTNRPKSSLMDRIEEDFQASEDIRNDIMNANLRLVVSIAKRHAGADDSQDTLISDGNMSLMRAIEKFDFSRGNKFSTYATWAIMKNFARSIPDSHKQRARFRTGQDELLDAAANFRSDQLEIEGDQARMQKAVGSLLDVLDEREQWIINRRFGLDHSRDPLTLKEVGEELGVTKERVRQLEARALNKLRKRAEQARIESPE